MHFALSLNCQPQACPFRWTGHNPSPTNACLQRLLKPLVAFEGEVAKQRLAIVELLSVSELGKKQEGTAWRCRKYHVFQNCLECFWFVDDYGRRPRPPPPLRRRGDGGEGVGSAPPDPRGSFSKLSSASSGPRLRPTSCGCNRYLIASSHDGMLE